MADHSHIEWTDATWNPVTGCSVVSPGCTNCYAMKLAGTRLRHHPSRAGLTIDSKAGPVWNGEVRFNEQWLDQPLRWKRPRMIFVCAHGDLFHEDVPDEWIDRVFAVMALCPQHTFQVLTKRSDRMREYVLRTYEQWHGNADNFADRFQDAMDWNMAWINDIDDMQWPLPNVWLGVSAEDQTRYDQRRRWLDETPAAIRFWSFEPLLGPIDMKIGHVKPDWVIVGGESGRDARPMHPDWARSLRDQCATANVPMLFKQWGSWEPVSDTRPVEHWTREWMLFNRDGILDIPDERVPIDDYGEVAILKVGKKRAGRLLDGIEHNGFPAVREVPLA